MSGSMQEKINNMPLLETLGIRCTAITADYCRMEVTVDARHRNYYGCTHGGLLATLIDTACFFAEPLIPSGRVLATSQLSVNYLRPSAVDDHLVAESKILHLGRRTVHVEVCVHNQRGELIAHGTGALLDVSPADAVADA